MASPPAWSSAGGSISLDHRISGSLRKLVDLRQIADVGVAKLQEVLVLHEFLLGNLATGDEPRGFIELLQILETVRIFGILCRAGPTRHAT